VAVRFARLTTSYELCRFYLNFHMVDSKNKTNVNMILLIRYTDKKKGILNYIAKQSIVLKPEELVVTRDHWFLSKGVWAVNERKQKGIFFVESSNGKRHEK
jgi:hypothetical protein